MRLVFRWAVPFLYTLEPVVESPSSSDLRSVVADLVSDRPSRRAVQLFLDHSQQIATAYLRRRMRLGRLRLDQFELSVEDLALDCLADLFRRDEDGRFVRLRAYQALVDWEGDGPGLEMAVRRLIFSVVNEGLFRRYRESDPTVGRFIRTLKRHVKQSDRLELERVHASQLIVLRGAAPERAGQPRMPPEMIEAYLHDTLDERCQLAGTVESLARLLESHPDYAPHVPLPELAVAIRNVLVRRESAENPDHSVAPDGYDERNFTNLVTTYVERSTNEVQSEKRAFYVDHRGVSPELYRAYFRAVGDILAAQFATAGRPDDSFRVSLNRYMDSVGSKEYRKSHQAVLEHLVNLTKNRFLQQMATVL